MGKSQGLITAWLIATWAGIALPAGSARGEPLLSVPDTDPNDTISQAVATGLVDLGTAIASRAEIDNGPLGPADRDFFSVEVTESAPLPLLLTVAMTADDPDYDGYVRLFGHFPQLADEPEGLIELANHDDIDATHLDPSLQTYIVEPGTYTVSASHSLNPAFSPADDSSGRPSAEGGFDLAVLLSQALKPDSTYETGGFPCIDAVPVSVEDGPLEPNDSISESTPSELAGPGSASFAASIGDGLFGVLRGDADFYQTPSVLDERLAIEVSPTGDPASLIPVLHLYDDLGVHLAWGSVVNPTVENVAYRAVEMQP